MKLPDDGFHRQWKRKLISTLRCRSSSSWVILGDLAGCFTMSRSVQEWVNDCVWPLCLIQAWSISGIWPVYFAAICSTSQHRKDSVCHSPSPVAWPQLKKKCQEMFSWISYTADVMGKRCECRENVEAKQDIANFPDQVCYDILFKNKTKKC